MEQKSSKTQEKSDNPINSNSIDFVIPGSMKNLRDVHIFSDLAACRTLEASTAKPSRLICFCPELSVNMSNFRRKFEQKQTQFKCLLAAIPKVRQTARK